MKVKILSQREIKQALSMSLAIQAVREAYIAYSRKEALMPLRIQLPVKPQEGSVLFMPAYLERIKSLGAKIVSVFPRNIEKKIPTLHALIILIDSDTGKIEAIMDGSYLTALRTGACSGVGTHLLARKGARSVAIFGAGVQGRTQLEAVCEVRTIEKVWVYDKNLEASKTYAQEMRERGKPIPEEIIVAKTAKDATLEADIICTATTSLTPVFEDSFIKPGVHINAIGSYTPRMQEIPEETVARAKIFVDSLSSCLEEAGDLIIPLKKGIITESKIEGEIGMLADGLIRGRESEEEVTLFKSVGLAVQDVAVSKLALEKANEMGLGISLEL